MSRGGRGRGSNKSFSREQLTSLGVGNNEVLPGPVTQPPPLFPLLDRKPISLSIDSDMKYQLMLKQDFICNLNDSPAYIKLTNKSNNSTIGDYQIDKLIAQMPNAKNTFDWALFPTELRPKVIAKKVKKVETRVQVKTENDIEAQLDKLEQIEKSVPLATNIKEEREEVEDEELLEDNEEDEEMDDGTDYANNYFDNGEAYEDEDDNLEDGPIY